MKQKQLTHGRKSQDIIRTKQKDKLQLVDPIKPKSPIIELKENKRKIEKSIMGVFAHSGFDVDVSPVWTLSTPSSGLTENKYPSLDSNPSITPLIDKNPLKTEYESLQPCLAVACGVTTVLHFPNVITPSPYLSTPPPVKLPPSEALISSIAACAGRPLLAIGEEIGEYGYGYSMKPNTPIKKKIGGGRVILYDVTYSAHPRKLFTFNSSFFNTPTSTGSFSSPSAPPSLGPCPIMAISLSHTGFSMYIVRKEGAQLGIYAVDLSPLLCIDHQHLKDKKPKLLCNCRVSAPRRAIGVRPSASSSLDDNNGYVTEIKGFSVFPGLEDRFFLLTRSSLLHGRVRMRRSKGSIENSIRVVAIPIDRYSLVPHSKKTQKGPILEPIPKVGISIEQENDDTLTADPKVSPLKKKKKSTKSIKKKIESSPSFKQHHKLSPRVESYFTCMAMSPPLLSSSSCVHSRLYVGTDQGYVVEIDPSHPQIPLNIIKPFSNDCSVSCICCCEGGQRPIVLADEEEDGFLSKVQDRHGTIFPSHGGVYNGTDPSNLEMLMQKASVTGHCDTACFPPLQSPVSASSSSFPSSLPRTSTMEALSSIFICNDSGICRRWDGSFLSYSTEIRVDGCVLHGCVTQRGGYVALATQTGTLTLIDSSAGVYVGVIGRTYGCGVVSVDCVKRGEWQGGWEGKLKAEQALSSPNKELDETHKKKEKDEEERGYSRLAHKLYPTHIDHLSSSDEDILHGAAQEVLAEEEEEEEEEGEYSWSDSSLPAVLSHDVISSVCYDGTVRLWDGGKRIDSAIIAPFDKGRCVPLCVTWSDGGDMIAVGFEEGVCRVYETESCQLIASFSAVPSSAPRGMASVSDHPSSSQSHQSPCSSHTHAAGHSGHSACNCAGCFSPSHHYHPFTKQLKQGQLYDSGTSRGIGGSTHFGETDHQESAGTTSLSTFSGIYIPPSTAITGVCFSKNSRNIIFRTYSGVITVVDLERSSLPVLMLPRFANSGDFLCRCLSPVPQPAPSSSLSSAFVSDFDPSCGETIASSVEYIVSVARTNDKLHMIRPDSYPGCPVALPLALWKDQTTGKERKRVVLGLCGCGVGVVCLAIGLVHSFLGFEHNQLHCVDICIELYSMTNAKRLNVLFLYRIPLPSPTTHIPSLSPCCSNGILFIAAPMASVMSIDVCAMITSQFKSNTMLPPNTTVTDHASPKISSSSKQSVPEETSVSECSDPSMKLPPSVTMIGVTHKERDVLFIEPVIDGTFILSVEKTGIVALAQNSPLLLVPLSICVGNRVVVSSPSSCLIAFSERLASKNKDMFHTHQIKRSRKRRREERKVVEEPKIEEPKIEEPKIEQASHQTFITQKYYQTSTIEGEVIAESGDNQKDMEDMQESEEEEEDIDRRMREIVFKQAFSANIK
ncbi:hypothetical protein ADUPG1_006940 [Aduncisulcus paluster]|uniref:Uncharacterized protein n=1 Tax=Aduncisulcus paluster TaxID=2918883 RepID=A0ABQ5KK48_9EUKA|nr:hypothetical protein ADUPG1_006940 [Aduncisulcus paluster]